MSNIDKRALREAAEKATPGRIGDRIDGSGSIKYQCIGSAGTLVLQTDHKNMEYGFIGENSEADELFFRMCDPATVLALLDELEANDKINAELMEKQRLIDICQGQGLDHRIAAEKRAEAAEKRVAELEARVVKLPDRKSVRFWPGDAFEFDSLGYQIAVESAIKSTGIKVTVDATK